MIYFMFLKDGIDVRKNYKGARLEAGRQIKKVLKWSSLMSQTVKNPSAMWSGILRFSPWVGKIPCRREWLPTLVFLPREFHGQRSPWHHKQSDMSEQLTLSLTFKVVQRGMRVV